MKQVIRLTESDLHRIVKESVKKILRECGNGYSIDTSMIEDGIDEEGEGATTADASGQYLAGSGIVGNKNFMGPATDRESPVSNMGVRV